MLIRPALIAERADAFRLIFDYLTDSERETRAANGLDLIARGELEGDGLLVADDGGRVVGALVCTPAPGAGALVWPPRAVNLEEEVEDALTRHAMTWLRNRGCKVAQALLVLDETPLVAPLERNGFAHVTTLWYMRHFLDLTAPLFAASERLTYVPFTRDPARFHETLLHTYEGTQDCPELSGVRTIDEIIEGHRAQGRHDPERWWLGLAGRRPAGVLLLTMVSASDGWDVSYVGVVPEARRRGVGRELMHKALLEARLGEARQLTLSVDVRNRPAWELYRGLGFEAFESREVYLALWKGDGAL